MEYMKRKKKHTI